MEPQKNIDLQIATMVALASGKDVEWKLIGSRTHSFDDMFNKATFPDGEPFGVKI